MNKNIQINLSAKITEELKGKRIDQALAILFPEHSRARLQGWIKQGNVLIDGKTTRSKDKAVANKDVLINATIVSQEDWEAQPIDIDIVYEDDEIIVINKHAGLVVHPGAGTPDNTLLNALLHHLPQLNNIPRAGIIHRLDKDTTGLLVVTKTLTAHTKLSNELQKHKIKREYEAVVHGVMTAGGTINAPIGRHHKDRIRMTVIDSGKPAVTHYRVIQKFSSHTHVRINLKTGRTHQIRVHLAHIGYPIVGDRVYGGRQRIPNFPRQALHARCLEFVHPSTNEPVTFNVALPDDMRKLILEIDPQIYSQPL